jgi:hypothetical protein
VTARAVVVCTDFSAASAAGEREAAARFAGDTIVVVHVVDQRLAEKVCDVTGMDRSQLRGEMQHYADTRLDEIVHRLQSQGRRAVAELAQKGDPVEAVLEAVAKHRAHTIVVGAPSPTEVGRFRTLLARRTTVPLLLIPSEV